MEIARAHSCIITNRSQENGVFTALKDGVLQSLQIYVHADPTHRDKVIETYTFTVKYLPDAGNGRRATGLELDGPGSSVVSVGATNKALQNLFRHTIELCKELPDLPGTIFFSILLRLCKSSCNLLTIE